MRYLIVVEPAETGFSACPLDVPGSVATGRTREEVEAQMREAIELHIQGPCEEGHDVPAATSYSTLRRDCCLIRP
jgi:predicted RNase H-like HicB family nuclease